jgi:Na+/proline symporter
VLEVILVDEFAWIEANTGIPSLVAAVATLSAVALVWTLMGGIAIVIWTDTILFLILLLAVIVALWIVVAGLPGGVAEVASAAEAAGKLRFWDTSGGFDRPYTLWAALFAVSFGNIGAYGTDQMIAQRLLCCRGVREARRAIVVSYAGMLVTVLVGCVGLALYAWYQAYPLEGRALELATEKPDRIFPLFVIDNVPTGLKGLILAGIFAAAIGGLDGILAALAQTTLTAWIGPWRARRGRPFDERGALSASRALIVAYCFLLAAIAVGCEAIARHYNSILDLALAMAGYTQGALLAGFLLAFLPLGIDGRGFLWSAPLSMLAVYAVAWSDGAAWQELGSRNGASAWVVVIGVAAAAWAWLFWGRHTPPRPVLAAPARQAAFAAALGSIVALHAGGLVVAWPWYVPIGCAFALAFGYLWGGRTPAAGSPTP